MPLTPAAPMVTSESEEEPEELEAEALEELLEEETASVEP